jgi:integrase
MIMARIKHVTHEIDRHGKPRWYFRRGKEKKIPMPDPASPKFAAAYADALNGIKPERALVPRSARAGSVRHAVTLYYGTAEYAQLRERTRMNYRRVLERFAEKFGDLLIADLGESQIQRLIDGIAAKTPGAADHLLKRIRGVLRAARLHGLIQGNPARDVMRPKYRRKPHHSWTAEEERQFMAHYPLGTRARTAFELLLCVGARRSDVVLLGRQHVSDGVLRYTQSKTGIPVEVPLAPRLVEALAAYQTGHLTFLVTAYGAPMTANGFGGWFSAVCRAAGLPDRCRAHGLRKASGRTLAEAGCSAAQIMAILGHLTLSESQKYVAAFERGKAAADGIGLAFGTSAQRESVQPSFGLDKSGEKSNKINGV